VTSAGLAVLIRLPAEARDLDIVESCRRAGLEPSPLSIWYVTPRQDSSGLLLGITNVTDDKIVRSCDALASLLPQT